MAHWVSVWRAAQLVGVPRGVLQQRVRRGEIALQDGLVSTDTLLALYPQAELESQGLFERVTQIREDAFARRLRERLLPSQEVLAQRLFRQGQELADTQRHLQRYHALVIALRDHIRAQRADGDDARLQDLERQLNDGLARALATEPVDMLDVMDDVLKVVSAQVTLRPSGHQFTVEGRDTLLQAGLKAGLKLNYGCGNGTCGLCKVRVMAGEVARTMPTDCPVTDLERAQGVVLACAHTAASSELTLETLEASGPADIAPQSLVATVRAVKPLGVDTLELHLQTPRTHRLRFLAGQAVTLGLVGADGEDVAATYPVASCPCDDRNLHFYVPRRDDDPLALRLFDGAVRAGAAMGVRGPLGDFVLADGARPLVFAACDTGFAPVKSLIEHAMSLDAAPSMSLFWLATRPDGHFMGNLCRAWTEALDGFETTLLDGEDPGAGARQMAEAMRADLFEVDCDFYLAGPPAFVDGLGGALQRAGVPPRQVRSLVT
ncbi:2Fe-2S iron-sulfur cluster-binding protein [Rubrivivax albus]|uniref:2Fe-2S iron-sulfur cluster binding domain-containing protein n=1 Tax=Rubrivivax albus TaxID=2499835 RepID=A0A3S2VXY8_9BURK|nr:2Fe-2S iron-sulfur cluster-binding protein [Rubrivivax albus]RVT52384.1 2Fe-2S iron-sulfur cluster binding domain-containing protein [Rubrivivax albus]